MAVIDGVFYLDARTMYKRTTLSVVSLELSQIMATRHYGER